MYRLRVLGLRISFGAAVGLVLLLAQLATSNRGYAKHQTVYAIDATPTPTTVPVGPLGQTPPTPTVIAPPGAAQAAPGVAQPGLSAPAGGNPSGAADPVSALQHVSDQIGAVSLQVTQTLQDSSLTVDAKVQRINSLAAQFNQLVAQWQQQLAQIPSSSAAPPVPPVAGVQATQTATTAQNGIGATATPLPDRSSPLGGPTADQLRAQIAVVSQQLAQVSQDSSLPADVKTAKLSALGAQFNQLMMQLQQLGG